MKFTPAGLSGAYIVDVQPHGDERGFFARSWCETEFAEQGLNACIKQCNISFNQLKGTLRGLHYQADPHGEVKLVRCTKGAIFDVIIDVRPDSSSYKQHFSIELNEDNRRMLYIPQGFAHGFQTLLDNTEVFYQMSTEYVAESARGLRWNDPAFGIEWPDVTKRIMSQRDEEYPDFIA